MKDLSKLEEISARIAERDAANIVDKLERDNIIVAGRKDNFSWPRLAAAARLTVVATENAARKANRGILPKPKNRE